MSTRWTICDGPLGPLTLVGGPRGLTALHFAGAAPALDPRDHDEYRLWDAVAQLREYLAGDRRRFDLALDLRGTALETRVWRELAEVPYGTTVSYAELAVAAGRPRAVRAVAGAVARTPVPVVVPCHRVIGSDGSLRGYVGGLARKEALIALERAAGAGRGDRVHDRVTPGRPVAS